MYLGFLTEVLFVTHFFHPFDNLAVECFLNGDVRHCRRWRAAVPMPLIGWAPDDITRPEFHFGLAFTLHPAEAGGDD